MKLIFLNALTELRRVYFLFREVLRVSFFKSNIIVQVGHFKDHSHADGYKFILAVITNTFVNSSFLLAFLFNAHMIYSNYRDYAVL
jgi:hypothetical protein